MVRLCFDQWTNRQSNDMVGQQSGSSSNHRLPERNWVNNPRSSITNPSQSRPSPLENWSRNFVAIRRDCVDTTHASFHLEWLSQCLSISLAWRRSGQSRQTKLKEKFPRGERTRRDRSEKNASIRLWLAFAVSFARGPERDQLFHGLRWKASPLLANKHTNVNFPLIIQRHRPAPAGVRAFPSSSRLYKLVPSVVVISPSEQVESRVR